MKLKLAKTPFILASVIATLLFSGGAGAENKAGALVPPLIANDANWSLLVPPEPHVVYRGVVSFDQAGGQSGQILYPVGGALGLLAAVVAHGMINESVKDHEKNQLQESADSILLPYQSIINNYTYQQLMQQGVQKITAGGNKKLVQSKASAADDWLLESAPIFSLTQDQSALLIDNVISIYAPHTPATIAYQNTIRVVANATDSNDLTAYWSANEGEKLKQESAALFAESLNIVLGQLTIAASQDGKTSRTVRYLEGSSEKMERGVVLGEQCDRVVIKTLRGWFMSVPEKPGVAGAVSPDACATVPATP